MIQTEDTFPINISLAMFSKTIQTNPPTLSATASLSPVVQDGDTTQTVNTICELEQCSMLC